ncbi:BRCT domain-containing protein [Marinomonas mediterranea]|jgi:NAD-dependent DNA ligase (contains BRCT domain type II)|uniref:NAD-dependent DNA ligase n=1 Tax=Marinomonas mediterranea (strain ATCC 700492 / JCM 21426 / NBRC 103028 / MMB-1) TaxID=717774 RepID=F2K246_MARM1|nr:BRCT domain-containing protein [Marinomonas mediterranea]ADZ91124.1 hypothetical protein Marme_1869 [Marinomonas mediterranea MMB-1]WCN17255.1 hypothetical protein GV053_09425 [Marinomonas mediterranea MMB-1]
MEKVSYFCLDRNRKKAAISLKGILQGVVADQELNEVEILFLDVWLKSQEHLRDDSDAIDLLDAVGDILADGVVTEDEIDDLKTLLEDIVKFKEVPLDKNIDRVNEFLALVSGVVADDILNTEELSALIDWLSRNDDLFSTFPINLVVKKMEQLEQSVSQETMSEELLQYLKKVSGANFCETGSVEVHPLAFIEDEIDSINHLNSSIVVSGEFDMGSRDDVKDIAIGRGYRLLGSVSKKTDYLVFGSKVSPNWGANNFGGKIEKAVKLKLEGYPIKIISESQWISFL